MTKMAPLILNDDKMIIKMLELEEIIRGEIEASGPMTFARFMELALYHPEYGYYASGRVRIGKEGDFYTNPHMGPVFGRMLAETFLKMRESLSGDAIFVEAGAGEGWFARDFLEGLRLLHPGDFARQRYIIVERSEALRKRQMQTLGGLCAKVEWCESIEELAPGLRGVIFSNELIDAMPFHRVRQERDALREVYVTLGDGGFAEVTGRLSTPDIPRYFNRIMVILEEGTTTEVNLAGPEWIAKAASALSEGFIITVDYGYTAEEYYAPERKEGTFLCYHRHTSNSDPYSLVGEQDITAHADFSSLAQSGRLNGAEPVLFTDQTSFLLESIGWLEASMRAAGAGQEEMVEAAMGMKGLVHPEWMGGAFKALVQAKGVSGFDLYRRTRNSASTLLTGQRALEPR